MSVSNYIDKVLGRPWLNVGSNAQNQAKDQNKDLTITDVDLRNFSPWNVLPTKTSNVCSIKAQDFPRNYLLVKTFLEKKALELKGSNLSQGDFKIREVANSGVITKYGGPLRGNNPHTKNDQTGLQIDYQDATGQINEIYYGSFKNGSREGSGILLSQDGSIVFSKFKNGQPGQEASYFTPDAKFINLKTKSKLEDLAKADFNKIAKAVKGEQLLVDPQGLAFRGKILADAKQGIFRTDTYNLNGRMNFDNAPIAEAEYQNLENGIEINAHWDANSVFNKAEKKVKPVLIKFPANLNLQQLEMHFEGGLPHGRFKAKYKNGCNLEGKFVQGFLDLEQDFSLSHRDGSTYRGQLKFTRNEDLLDHPASMYAFSSSLFANDFVIEGQGTYKHGKNIIEGTWEDARPANAKVTLNQGRTGQLTIPIKVSTILEINCKDSKYTRISSLLKDISSAFFVDKAAKNKPSHFTSKKKEFDKSAIILYKKFQKLLAKGVEPQKGLHKYEGKELDYYMEATQPKRKGLKIESYIITACVDKATGEILHLAGSDQTADLSDLSRCIGKSDLGRLRHYRKGDPVEGVKHLLPRLLNSKESLNKILQIKNTIAIIRPVFNAGSGNIVESISYESLGKGKMKIARITSDDSLEKAKEMLNEKLGDGSPFREEHESNHRSFKEHIEKGFILEGEALQHGSFEEGELTEGTIYHKDGSSETFD